MFETGIEKAQAAIHKLRDARTELEAKAEAAGAELAKLREGAGEAELAAILEGIEVGPIRARAVELDMQISGLAGARMALMKRIAAAEKALQTAKAEGIRAEGGKLQKKLSEHLAESRRLQAALEKHEGGCPYIPLAEAQSALMAANPGTPADRTVLKWPDSMRLQQEINALMAKAAAVENARIEAGGNGRPKRRGGLRRGLQGLVDLPHGSQAHQQARKRGASLAAARRGPPGGHAATAATFTPGTCARAWAGAGWADWPAEGVKLEAKIAEGEAEAASAEVGQ
jgi:hypothetical protein